MLLLLRDLRPISLMIFSVLLSLWSSAQKPITIKPLSNLRQKSFRIAGDTLQIDTTSIVSKTFIVEGIDPPIIAGFCQWHFVLEQKAGCRQRQDHLPGVPL
jgi:hypothetical protein